MRQVAPTLEDELERLALASPHLLTDLGFCEDRGTGDPAQTIWRRGALRVTISHAKTAVLIDVAP